MIAAHYTTRTKSCVRVSNSYDVIVDVQRWLRLLRTAESSTIAQSIPKRQPSSIRTVRPVSSDRDKTIPAVARNVATANSGDGLPSVLKTITAKYEEMNISAELMIATRPTWV